jgi:serpin B
MSSSLAMDCKLARDYTLENAGDTLAYLLIKLTPVSSLNTSTLPINLCLVIDVSRSMKGDKITSAVEAAKTLVNSLKAEDWVSVITFSDEAKVTVSASQAGDRKRILSLIDEIRIQSSTRMFLGMEMGALEMNRAGLDDKINQMILLTDGETENGELCLEIAQREKATNLIITTLGCGKKYNENLLAQISDTTLGRFYHLNDPSQISSILQKEFRTASDSFIPAAKLSLSLEQGVRLESLDRIFPNCVRLQPASEAGGKILSCEIGAIQKESPTIMGAQLKLPSHAAGRSRVAEVSVNYDIPDLQTEDCVQNYSVTVEYTSYQELCGLVDQEVINYFNQINSQKLVEKAINETKRGDVAGATRSLTQAQEITRRLGNISLAEAIKIAKDELSQKGIISEEGLKTIKANSRFTVKIDPIYKKQAEKHTFPISIVPPSDLKALVQSNNSFAFNLFHYLKKEEGNLFFSPLSISEAMAMTYVGARGKTRDEMAKVLNFALFEERLPAIFSSLESELKKMGTGVQGRDEKGFRFSIANALWGQQGLIFLPSFLETIKKGYGGNIQTVDFRYQPNIVCRTINRWIEDQTSGKIRDMLWPNMISELTKVLITNAIYFKIAWAFPFEEVATSNDIFHTSMFGDVSVPMMHQSRYFNYAEGYKYQAIELPTSGEKFSMIIFLPRQGQFDNLENNLNPDMVQNTLANLRGEYIELAIPKFRYETCLNLNEALKKMGIKEAFSDGADFWGMVEKFSLNLDEIEAARNIGRTLCISQVLHKAYVSVDEAGSEAAVATAVIMSTGSLGQEKKRVIFNINRPFIFLIREAETDSILFIGRVLNA